MTSTLDAAPASRVLPRLLPGVPVRSLDEHLARHGGLPSRLTGLIDEVEAAGLRGRGGAAFPTAQKMRAVAGRRRALVIANGTEGEPASAKDKALIATSPHLVLDGVVAAAVAVGAREGVVCVSTGRLRDVLVAALAERRDPVAVRVEQAPHRYVAGEATALAHWLAGGEAKPTFSLDHLADRGVLVDNVETLAHVACIARHGAAWFRSAGTAEDPGTALVTVSGAVSRPGVYEVPFGTRLDDVLERAGVVPGRAQAVLVGGYAGTWARGDLVLTSDVLGCGVIAVLPGDACGLMEAARVTAWMAGQGAGQCGPCVLGLPAIAAALDAVSNGEPTGGAERDLRRWLGLVKGRGACKHPDGVARFVESTLSVFADEVAAHRNGPCGRTACVLPTPATEGWR
jgi:NADH:ubiquinone oxidoreductase subunit F (NADH-binding)